jgi:diacylglycerol kinase (ATP)
MGADVIDDLSSGALTFVIINPVSGPAHRGGAADRVRVATAALESVGLRAEILLTESAGHAYELARHAVGAGAALVIAWGGDGTINEVGRAVAFTSTALGIVPAGSGNGLARELGIPFSPRRALEHALRRPARQIDSAEVDGRLFFNVAGIGLDAQVAERVSRAHHAHGGLHHYVVASSHEILTYKPREYTIRTDTGLFRTSAWVVAVANSRQYGYGAVIAPTARLDDGELDLVVIEDLGLSRNLLRLPSLLTGGLHRRRGVSVVKVKDVTISTETPMLFHVDGEAVRGTNTVSVRVRPGALRVRA